MATIEDYASGRVLVQARNTFAILKASDTSLAETVEGENMLKAVSVFAPRLLSYAEAARIIDKASLCAVGERICGPNHPNAPLAEAIFLDELAEAMTSAEKAGIVTKKEALSVLEKYKLNPKVISKVAGKPMELCCTAPDTCIYWNMERRGLKCIRRTSAPNETSQ